MRPRAALIAAAGATALAAIALHWTGVLDRFDLAAYDARLALRGERAPPRDVVVVGVDERTLEARNERWPFPRAVQARLVDRLRQAGVRLIVYDIQIT